LLAADDSVRAEVPKAARVVPSSAKGFLYEVKTPVVTVGPVEQERTP
jgi:hypothetical protein